MRVLFLPQTCALGPSSRYRVYQLLPLLEKQGIHCEVSPAIDEPLYRKLYLNEGGLGSNASSRAARRTAFLTAWQKRRSDLQRVGEFDVVFVQKGVFPGLYSGFESRIAGHKPFVFDIDDAVWLPREGGSPLLRWLHRERAVQDILRYAAAVIAGNEFLAEYARRFNRNVTVAPSALNVADYSVNRVSTTIGWIGSRTTLPYLKPLKPVFEKLHVVPRVIAAGDPSILGFAVEFRLWRLETELDELAHLGIGLAPLPDTPWEHGKCGVKILQYMACGIPVVASPVGVHRQIIQHAVNGLLAAEPAEWESYLRELIASSTLREKLGAAGRETVEKNYAVERAAAKVAAVLRSLK